jgi:Flp pilus assembly protein TadG
MRADDGATAVVVAVMIIVLLGFMAIVVDAGAMYVERRQMQTAADAASLAGVQELPGSPVNAVAAADQYAQLNTSRADALSFEVRSTYGTNDTLVATVQETAMQLFFARFLGRDTAPVGATATAMITSPSGYGSGVMPMGMMATDATQSWGYTYADYVTLKQASQQGESGNFQFVDLVGEQLDHSGGSGDITGPLENGGISEPVYVDELYYTQTGINGRNFSRAINTWIGSDTCTFESVTSDNGDGTVEILDDTCHRIVICPIIVNAEDGSANWPGGQSVSIRIVGFAYFFISEVGTSGNQGYINGRFIRPVNPDDAIIDWGPIDPRGAIAYHLVD